MQKKGKRLQIASNLQVIGRMRKTTLSRSCGFYKNFFAKHTLLNILTRYCVFTSENLLLVMRPYQISATEKILNRIIVSTNLKKIR